MNFKIGNTKFRFRALPLRLLVKELGIAVGICVIIFVFFLIFTIPKVFLIINLFGQLREQDLKIKQLNSKLNDLRTLSESDLFDSSSLLLEALPLEGDIYKIINTIKKIFYENHVNLTSFAINPESGQDGGISYASLNLSFSSTFPDFKQTVGILDKTLPLISVESIKVTLSTSSDDILFPNVSGKMTLKSFFSSLPKDLGKAEKPLPKISGNEINLIESLRSYKRYFEELSSEESAVTVGKENPFPI